MKWRYILASLVLLGLAVAIVLLRPRTRTAPPPQPLPPIVPVERHAGPEAKNIIPVEGRPGQQARGTAGDDKLLDRTGGSTLLGLDGSDTYQAPDERTRVVERAGEGLDSVETWNSYRLPPHVENLVLVGKYSTGTAGRSGSLLISKGHGNVLESGPGSDTMIADPEASQTVFLFHPGSGADAIVNFKAKGDPHDFIRLSHPRLCRFDQIRRRMARTADGDTLLRLGARDGILLKGVPPAELTADNFLLCFHPDRMKLAFRDEFDRLSLHDPITGQGRWKTAFAHAPATGPQSREARRLAGNHDEQIYVDAGYAGNPARSGGPLGLDPFSIDGGVLSIRAWRLPPAASARLWGHRFASGLLTSEPSFAQRYGYFEIRAELPQRQGLFPAFWLLPKAGGWPPEIDIMENVGQDFVTAGLVAPGDRRTAFFIRFPDGVKGMHRYGVLWTPRRISWVFDGRVVGSAPTPPSMHGEMYMLLNLAVGGKWPGSPAPSFREAAMKVDYIRVYRWDGKATP